MVALIGYAVAFGNIGTTLMAYVENIIPLSNPHGREDEAWFQGWTVFMGMVVHGHHLLVCLSLVFLRVEP